MNGIKRKYMSYYYDRVDNKEKIRKYRRRKREKGIKNTKYELF